MALRGPGSHTRPTLPSLRDMDERIRFETKEEANERRRRAFLALAPSERFQWFLRSFEGRAAGARSEGEANGNFIIQKRRDPLR